MKKRFVFALSIIAMMMLFTLSPPAMASPPDTQFDVACIIDAPAAPDAEITPVIYSQDFAPVEYIGYGEIGVDSQEYDVLAVYPERLWIVGVGWTVDYVRGSELYHVECLCIRDNDNRHIIASSAGGISYLYFA